ncbi:AraC family transcriptional regulator with amidase-like domain [Nocardioides albertanoniae]|uniref:AraC family transcriptional regulator with amidase-like domain n=1 Tax=Nocardioides albertanoniae TaxID=1175486 RepID=A0A543A344_9ACTN|nr:helix-turn-helix domain-containing protein [Nocardioides albertanoniae]TQL67013.1 AraC family transcriptional regulator with amidase-like domain [Nocardioides albertanoniae]
MSDVRAPSPHRVAVLIQDGFIPFESGIPHRIFGKARDSDGRLLYEVITCTTDGPGPVQSDSDMVVLAPHGPEALATADTVVVPKFGSYDLTSADEVLTAPLKEALGMIRPGTRIMSICTGAFALAAAGLLDGRPATTHWAHTDDFRTLFPQVKLDPDVLFVDDGDILTSAGVASGVDLCLHVVRRDHGAAVANRVARVTVVPPHRDGGQAQFIRRPAQVSGSSGISTAIAWALEHLDQPLTLEKMAVQVSMSVRTFTRRFRQETGESPGRWLQRQRIELARNLLETTDLTIDRVAARCGFNTAQSLRLHFHAALGVTPAAYRRTFHG